MASSKHKRQRSTGSAMNLGGGSSITSLFQKTLNPRHHLRGRIVKKAATVVDNYVTELTSKAPYLLSCDKTAKNTSKNSSGLEQQGPTTTTATTGTIPLLDRDELRVGKLLGEGGFCQVWDVKGVVLNSNNTTSTDKAQEEARRQLANNTPALAIKQLQKRLVKAPPKFTLAAADLVVEAQYLSRLAHPHIVPVRAMTRGHLTCMQEDGRYDAYFIVLDKLEVTLDKRIQNWQRGFENMPSYGTKLTWCWQIASALQYLHERRILFRDVKPHNIGFRADTQQLQLFDFGLCRELPPPRQRVVREEEEDEEVKVEEGQDEGSYFNDASSDEFKPHATSTSSEVEEEDDDDIDYDDYYLMTKVGTRRYSAVEMHISGRYNEKIDVYSWAMTVYEMISLCKPFASLSDADHQEYVCAQGKRPNTKAFLQQCEQPREGQTQPLLALIRQAWEQYVRYRIDIHTVVERMEEIIQERRDGGRSSPTTATAGTSSNNANLDKSLEVVGSVVSATTALTESDHDEMLNGNSGSVGPIAPPRLAGSNSNNNASIRLKSLMKKESEGTDEDASGSIQSLIVVNMMGGSSTMGSSTMSGVAGSRHSLMSTRSMETASSSGSAGWGDSINTIEGAGIGIDASLNNIVFDELLQNRRRANEWSEESSPVSTLGSPDGQNPSNKKSSKNAKKAQLKPTATAALAQPNAGDILPPALGKIASDMAQDEDDEENMASHWAPLTTREAVSS